MYEYYLFILFYVFTILLFHCILFFYQRQSLTSRKIDFTLFFHLKVVNGKLCEFQEICQGEIMELLNQFVVVQMKNRNFSFEKFQMFCQFYQKILQDFSKLAEWNLMNFGYVVENSTLNTCTKRCFEFFFL